MTAYNFRRDRRTRSLVYCPWREPNSGSVRPRRRRMPAAGELRRDWSDTYRLQLGSFEAQGAVCNITALAFPIFMPTMILGRVEHPRRPEPPRIAHKSDPRIPGRTVARALNPANQCVCTKGTRWTIFRKPWGGRRNSGKRERDRNKKRTTTKPGGVEAGAKVSSARSDHDAGDPPMRLCNRACLEQGPPRTLAACQARVC